MTGLTKGWNLLSFKNNITTIILVVGKVIPINHWIMVHTNIKVNQFHCSSLYLCKSVSNVSTIACNYHITMPAHAPLWASRSYPMSLGSRHPAGTDEGCIVSIWAFKDLSIWSHSCYHTHHSNPSLSIWSGVRRTVTMILFFHSLSIVCIGVQQYLTILISIVV